ncbi:MAG: hypothetical protein CL927_12125 [Deltaproteobacteria bacterium]|nr:hypothetical protein [Deltaproteobacteria bacterium]HCH63668.1 hypothetical protein [Deltaproteobacteria bacterium]
MTIDPTNPLGINDGSRPSHLDLDRRLMGEVPGDVPDAHRTQTEDAARALPPIDIEALRQRARHTDRPVRRPRRWLFPALLTAGSIAAAGMLVVQQPPPTPTPTVRVKGGPQLGWMVLRGDDVQMGAADQRVSPGDRVQFTWAGEVSSIVLIGVDGTGEQVVLWPPTEAGQPVPLEGASGMLEGSVELDDAAGPERFFAVFDAASVSAASRRVAEGMLEADSASSLRVWADGTPDVDVLILDKIPR